jgi:hypothetical protein
MILKMVAIPGTTQFWSQIILTVTQPTAAVTKGTYALERT